MLKLKINEKNLIANLSHAFTSKNNLFTELAQNSRRAKATSVSFTLNKDQRTFEVEDDGSGIKDFQNLLTVAESGWDYETAQTENPFGMGFLIAIYLSDFIEVESLDQKFSASKADILQGKELQVTKIPFRKGTKISLKGVQEEVFKVKFENTFSAFQIPVIVNNQELERTYAKEILLKNDSYVHQEFWFGDFFCSRHAYLDFNNVELFFQGFQVSNPYYRGAVIHLKESEFKVRMPDRETLIDYETQVTAITDTIQKWQQEEIKKNAKDFSWLVENKKVLEKHNLMNLFNAFDQVPNFFLKELTTDVPWCSSNKEAIGGLSQTPMQKIFTKKDLMSAKIISHFYTSYDMWDGDQGFALHTYLYKLNALILSPLVPKDHWLNTFTKTHEEALQALKVTPINPAEPNAQPDFYTESYFMMCDSLEIEGCFGKITVTDCAITYTDDGDCYQTFIPKDEKTNAAVAQVAGFQGEYSYDETAQYHAEKDFDSWLLTERMANDPEQFLIQELKSLVDRLPSLRGKSFQINFMPEVIKVENEVENEDDESEELPLVTVKLL